MARKKTVSDEPEFQGYSMEENQQYLEGDAPGGGELSDGAPTDGGEVPAVPEDGEAPFTGDGSDSAEESASDPQYEELLHEMDSSSPFPSAEDGAFGLEGEAAPLMETPADDVPPVSDGTEAPFVPETQDVEVPGAGEAPAERDSRPRTRRAPTQRSDYVLTIDARDHVQTEEEREEIIWHEVRNAYRTRRILTGILGGVEQTRSGRTLAIVDYKGFRVAIPVLEMMLYTGEMPSNRKYLELMGRLNRMLSTMLGAEIDFIV